MIHPYNSDGYPLAELVTCSAIDPDTLTTIENALRERTAAGDSASYMIDVDRRGLPLLDSRHAADEGLLEIAAEIESSRVRAGRPAGIITVHAAIVPFHLEPNWHYEPFDGYVVTTVEATEGLRGNVPPAILMRLRSGSTVIA